MRYDLLMEVTMQSADYLKFIKVNNRMVLATIEVRVYHDSIYDPEDEHPEESPLHVWITATALKTAGSIQLIMDPKTDINEIWSIIERTDSINKAVSDLQEKLTGSYDFLRRNIG
jgi:hypothetical protein